MNWLMLWSGLVFLPATIAHEATHAALVYPWADDVKIAINLEAGTAECRVNYRDDVPQWPITIAHYGPGIIGSLLAVIAVAWLLSVGDAPSRVSGWLWWSVLGVWWYIYTGLSDADKNTEVNP
jgi:hypothetical protein